MDETLRQLYMLLQDVIVDELEQRGYIVIRPGDLSEEEILKHVRTRTYAYLECSILNEEPEICIICQSEYENSDKIGTLRCGYEYHMECIKGWLQIKNACPLCKTTAATP
ncbi:hypothetical protein NMG60_11019263 [Bertholletia excelsa]